MRFRRLTTVVAALLMITPLVIAISAANEPALVEAELVRAALSPVWGEDPTGLAQAQDAVRREIARLVGRMGEGRPSYRRGARLHRILHRDYLRTYRSDADGLQQIVLDGEYNCLSATLFYGLVARALGYEVEVLEYPGHLLLGLKVDGRRVEVETTSPHGFDRQRHTGAEQLPSPEFSRREVTRAHLRPSTDSPHHARASYREVSLEAAVGFAWLNTAWRALDAGETIRAAKCAAEALRYYPYISTQAGDVRRLLSRAFRLAYESGEFKAAYRIATFETELLPTMTTARDRLTAAAVKRIEDACDDDDPSLGGAIIAEVVSIAYPGRDVTRFERRAWPIVVASAVRLGEWELSRWAAARYAAVEPDPIEARRVVDWVEERMSQDATEPTTPVCADLANGSGPRAVSH
jgi:hypothetical protein